MILMENTWLTKQQVAFNSKDRDLIETCLKNNLVVEVVCQKKSNRLIICFSAAYKEVEASHVKLTSFPDGDDEILWSELIYPSVEVQKRVKKYMMSYNWEYAIAFQQQNSVLK